MLPQRLSTRWQWLFVAIALILIIGRYTVQASERALAPPNGLLPPEKPTVLPDFSLPSVDGKTLTAADLRGHVVVMRFWSTW